MSCGDCDYFIAQSGYHLIYDGYCTLLKSGDSNKGVNRSNSCNNFSQRSTAGNSGFQGGCFLSSACVEYLGKPDDCEELTKLRAFRDNFMKPTDYGSKLVDEYYQVAPKIVAKINASNNKDKYYADIYKTIVLCIKAIDGGKNNDALTLYKEMVDKYKKEFNL